MAREARIDNIIMKTLFALYVRLPIWMSVRLPPAMFVLNMRMERNIAKKSTNLVGNEVLHFKVFMWCQNLSVGRPDRS